MNPGDHVELVPTEQLIPYARNARTHSEEQIAQVAASIREFGFTSPILRDEQGTVLAGHGRLAAARRLGLKTVPVITAQGWSEAKKRAYVIADNKLSLNAGWDYELLAAELEDLKAEDFELSLTGFDANGLQMLLDSPDTEEGETDPEEEWEGMPEYDGDYGCFKKVIVNFDSQEDVDEFFSLISQTENGDKKSIWFPTKERRDIKNLEFSEIDD